MRNTFQSNDLTTTFSNVTGDGSSANVVNQINDLTAKITALTNERTPLKLTFDYVEPRLKFSTQHPKTNGKHWWLDVNGKAWVDQSTEDSFVKWSNQLPKDKARIDVIDKLLEQYKVQLKSLNDSLPAISAADPAIIAANAAASVAISKSESSGKIKKVIIYSLVGIAILSLIGFIVYKIRK